MNQLQHPSDARVDFPRKEAGQPQVLMGIVVLRLPQVWRQGGAIVPDSWSYHSHSTILVGREGPWEFVLHRGTSVFQELIEIELLFSRG